MRWTVRDIEPYFQEKEYVDTAIIPVVPVTWRDEIKFTIATGEFAVLMTGELERQLRGRVIHFPPFTYLKSEDMKNRLDRILKWKQELLTHDLKYVFFVTSDTDWKMVENQMEGSLIWMPVIPLEHMDPDHRQEIMNDQMKQLLQIITIKWQNGYNPE